MIERYAMVAVALVAAATAHPICNLLFRCGCGWFSSAHCNVHALAPPHCPWCTALWRFPLAVALWLVFAYGAIALARRRFGRRALSTLAAGLLGLALGAFVSGAITIAIYD